MIGLLTWPAYGTWLAGAARGWVDPGSVQKDATLPEPEEALSALRRRSLKSLRQQEVMLLRPNSW